MAKSISGDKPLTYLGKPSDAKRCSSAQTVLSHPHTYDRFVMSLSFVLSIESFY